MLGEINWGLEYDAEETKSMEAMIPIRKIIPDSSFFPYFI